MPLLVGPSIAVCGNTVCTFPSCSDNCRHRWLILIKWIAPPKKVLSAFMYSKLRCYSPDVYVRRTYGSFTSGAKNKWLPRRELIFGYRSRVAMMDGVACKFASINSYSSSNSTECRRQVGGRIRLDPDCLERTVCVMR